MSNALTKRDIVEERLLEACEGTLTTLDETCIPAINKHKEAAFGMSYLGLQLYANGHNIHSQSTHHPRGLFYNDGENAFGVGVFFRPDEPDTPCIHIISPAGPNWPEAVENFCVQAEAIYGDNAKIFIRQISKQQHQEVGTLGNSERIFSQAGTGFYNRIFNPGSRDPESGNDAIEEEARANAATVRYTDINYDPWLAGEAAIIEKEGEEPTVKIINGAAKEDESYAASIVSLDEMISSPDKGMFNNLSERGRLNLLIQIAINEGLSLPEDSPSKAIFDELATHCTSAVLKKPEPGTMPFAERLQRTDVPTIKALIQEVTSAIDAENKTRAPDEQIHPPKSHKSSRSAARSDFNGFKNFLAKNNLEYVLEPFSKETSADARELVGGHFDRLKERNKDVGSTKEDYESIISTDPENAAEAGLHMRVGYIQKKGEPDSRVAVSFFGFEDIGHDPIFGKSVGAYATVTSYEASRVEHLLNHEELGEKAPVGYANIAVYALGTMFHEVKSNPEIGAQTVKLGGSETHDLNRGKKKIGAVDDNTQWVVRFTPGEREALVEGKLESPGRTEWMTQQETSMAQLQEKIREGATTAAGISA